MTGALRAAAESIGRGRRKRQATAAEENSTPCGAAGRERERGAPQIVEWRRLREKQRAVILRNEVTKNLFFKILRYAQDDKCGGCAALRRKREGICPCAAAALRTVERGRKALKTDGIGHKIQARRERRQQFVELPKNEAKNSAKITKKSLTFCNRSVILFERACESTYAHCDEAGDCS